MKILVTGGAGFIGRTLVQMLAAAGHRVTVLDNFAFSNQSQIFRHKNVTWKSGDTRDRALVFSLVRGKDAIIHLAATSSFLMHEEDDIQATSFTVVGFKTVMEAMRRYGIPKIVWASTSAVYERNSVPYREDMALNPPDSKAGCKLFCEQEARRYSERYGITAIALRPFSVYGVGEHTKGGYANITSLFVWAMLAGEKPVVWGDGRQTRDFIFVEDAARGFIAALEADIPTQELNLGFGVEHSFNDVIAIIGEELGIDPRPTYVKVPIQIYAERLWADMTKTKRVLGFEAKVTLKEGIRLVIEVSRKLPKKRLMARHQFYWRKLPR